MTLQKGPPENFHLCRWGDMRTVKRAQTVSEDPHRRERKFSSVLGAATVGWLVPGCCFSNILAIFPTNPVTLVVVLLTPSILFLHGWAFFLVLSLGEADN